MDFEIFSIIGLIGDPDLAVVENGHCLAIGASLGGSFADLVTVPSAPFPEILLEISVSSDNMKFPVDHGYIEGHKFEQTSSQMILELFFQYTVHRFKTSDGATSRLQG